MKPPLKWAGGKRHLVPLLAELTAPYQHLRLVEPFCGGLAVALGLQPERALLNDINPHLINFYTVLRHGLRIRLPLINEASQFYAYRTRFNTLIARGKAIGSEAASLFYYLNRTGFNGLCRFNSSGLFNVPFGRYLAINYVRDFSPYKEPFQRWRFRCGPFDTVPLNPDDLVYADPPYDVDFTSYSKEGFSWNDQVRLAHWLKLHPGPVILSNQATKRIVALYQNLGFSLQFISAPRRISCNGDRTPAKELIATRNLP